MRLLLIDTLLRRRIREMPDDLFVFGDNLMRRGFGGQAAEARGEPNAVGVPTKKSPSMHDSAFLADADYRIWMQAAEADFDRIAAHPGIVHWPKQGIGTGLARLPERAPLIFAAIEAIRDHFIAASDAVDSRPADWRRAADRVVASSPAPFSSMSATPPAAGVRTPSSPQKDLFEPMRR